MGARRGRAGRLVATGLVTALVLGACSGGDDDASPTTTAPTEATIPDETGTNPTVVNVAGGETAGVQPLGLRLSEGTASATEAIATPLVSGTPLTADEVAALLARLPEWVVPGDDPRPFNRPATSLTPPLVGDTVDTPFPPPPDPGITDPDALPLEVVRFQPEGAVDVAPYLTVTFNQPMVPLTTLGQLDAADVPVVLTPAIDGRWRWIGARTLRFEVVPGATDRLPAATEYTVEVPEGTVSASGARLAETVSWTFRTPAPQVTGFVGESESLPLEPVFVAVFDQIVDPEAVLATVSLDAGGDDVAVRPATADEIDADDAARQTVANALPGRAVAFRAEAPLEPDQAITVTVGPGTPSTEGPLTTTDAYARSGRTYGAFDIRSTDCGYGGACVPGLPFTIEMTNEIDPGSFSAEQVSVSPAVPGLRVDVYGTTIQLTGATAGSTEYEVTLAAQLADRFGQTLGEDRTVRFGVGPAQPALLGLQRDWITTDPFADAPTVPISTVNHDDVRVRAWAVTPADTTAFRAYLEASYSNTEPDAPAWPVVLDEVVDIDAEADRMVETAIDLSAAFAQGSSQIVVRVEPTEQYAPDSELWYSNRPTVAWVQSSSLAVDAFVDSDELLIWTTDLLTGEPVGNVAVELLGDGRVARTDADGLSRVPLADATVTGLFANAGDRTAFLPADWYGGFTKQAPGDEARWYVFDDRGIYKPGETARITGYVRRVAYAEGGTLATYDGAAEVTWRAFDGQDIELTVGSAAVNALGGFTLSVDLPAGANLGAGWVELQLVDATGAPTVATQHPLQIQEFRRPEFEVTARPESPGPFYAARPATVAVEATYFAGGPLPDAEVSWLVTTRQTTYRPPNWDQFQFGIWQPWWWFGDVGPASSRAFSDVECFDCGPGTGGAEFAEYAGRTDASGTHYLRIDFDGPDVDLPTSVTAEATVFDVDRQAWAARTDLVVHPAQYYVGLRSDRTFVEQGTPIRYDAVVTDVDGNAVAGREVVVTAARLEWGYANGTWAEEPVDEQTCTITSSADPADGTMGCEFATATGGQYRITAVVADDSGHRNRSESTQWVSGGQGRPVRSVEQEQVTIVPDRETYAPGDTAELLVQAPFAPATGLLTVSHAGIVSTLPFDAPDGSAVLTVPVDDASIPNLSVQVDMVGVATRTADDGTPLPGSPGRPAYAVGTIDLRVPPVTRALTVTATPAADALVPGSDTAVTVGVAGPDGAPVAGAEVALVVVDEAILSLTGYQLADPLDVFYAPLYNQLGPRYTRSSILLTRSDLLGTDVAEGAPATIATAGVAEESADASVELSAAGGAPPATRAADASAAPGTPIQVRDDFEPLAVYATGQVTGADGTVTVDVPLPDTLTRYRVMAVAVDGAQRFGKGESTITARLPLQVRPAAPRFLNYGDRFELPVILQNQTDAPLDVDVAVQAANLTVGDGSGTVPGTRVTVPANDRVEVRFAAAALEPGTARIRVVATSGDLADATEIELPVYTPATSEAFATYGVIDEDGQAIGQPLLAPAGVIPEFGGLEINTSSTAVQALTDAVISLEDYPYTTPDGYASRILAIASLRDVLDQFDAEGVPSGPELDARVVADIAALVALQNADGGWGWWTTGLESVPWPTLHAAHALVIARDAGYSVPPAALDLALAHLADIESYIPAEYGESERTTLRSFAIHVRTVAGDRDVAKATAIYREGGISLQFDALAWLWPSIDDATIRSEIERVFLNGATETAGAATFATSYGEDAYVIATSDRRTDAVVLDALISQTPESDLIPKVVAGILGNQRAGHWNSAQDDAFVLVALHRYFERFEAATPAFVAQAWLGTTYVAEQAFDGRTTTRATSLVPMAELVGVGEGTQLVLRKVGAGRLYYRLGLRYAPADLVQGARDEGFVVERSYAAVNDPFDVTRDADGTWRIRAGASVRVTVTMVADARRTHVALVDPLPAGLEAVNPALAVSQTFTPAPEAEGASPVDAFTCWCWQWFEHQNLRDDRVEAYTSFLPGGTYEYTYVARATTPGTFVVPPAHAEELYAPEVFGRSTSTTVVVG